MKKIFQNPINNSQKKLENSLALKCSDVLEFRRHTKHVWSKMAGRVISEREVDQIIEDFGRFVRILATVNGE